MLSAPPASRTGARRTAARRTAARRTAARRTGARRTGALCGATAVLACLTVAGGAGPARADSVRNRQQWVLDAINVQAAWAVSQGAGVTVAVVDSGVDPDVPDLVGSVRSGPDLTGVGTPPSNPNWGQHGTWMASIIAGHGHDGGGSGIIGVAPQARILSIRVITDKSDPGYAKYEAQPPSRPQDELAEGITDAVSDGASVISMSLGYSAPSRAVRVALQDAYAHNVVVVASSGNSGDTSGVTSQASAPYSFPADYPGVIGVGAVNQSGQSASFSSENQSVLVAAPGVNVPAEGRDSQYWLVSGTSPACAVTAGVAALIKSKYPGLSDGQVSEAITKSAWHRPPGGYNQQVGFGTVNAAAALQEAGRLARGRPRSASEDVTSSSHFAGSAADPAPPVPPRGHLGLVAWFLLGVACLAAIAVAALRLVASRPLPGGPRPPASPGLPQLLPAPRHEPGAHAGYPPPDARAPGDGYYPAPRPSDGYYPASRPTDVGPGGGYYPASRPTDAGPGGGYYPASRPSDAGPGDGYHPASRPSDAGPGDGPQRGAIRFPRSSRSPGRHAAPAELPSDRSDPR
jgi:type VII secretion-associated serine protease mycosin